VSLSFHAANVIFLLSYLVRDILWLRALAVVGQALLFIAAVAHPPVAWDHAAWNALFFSINLVRIYLLILERRPVKLSAREARLHQLAFRALTPRELTKLLATGAWREIESGAIVIERGKHPDGVLFLEDGRVDVVTEGGGVVELGPGSFVGEMSFLTGEAPRAEVRARAACRFFAWPKEALSKALRENPDLRAHVQAAIGRDLALKLRST
jgi:hypothetical protein